MILRGAEVRLPCARTAAFAGKAPALAEKHRKRAALPAGPTERDGPPPLSDSPRGLCGLLGTVAQIRAAQYLPSIASRWPSVAGAKVRVNFGRRGID